MSRITTLFALSLIFINVLHAQLSSYPLKHKGSYQAEQWEVIDLNLHYKQKVQNPFALALSAILQAPSGKKTTVPAFYNGEQNWVIRFSGNELGLWKAVTVSDKKELNGKTFRIAVGKATDSNKHGAITIHADNPQHFYYEDATPYFMLAFECDWLFALDYDNPTALPKSEHLMDLVRNNGFNQVVTNLYTYDVSWKKDPKLKAYPQYEYGGREDIFPFLGSNKKPDYRALNIAFFKKFDRSMALLHNKNLVAHLMIYVWNKLVNWPDMYTEADNMYFDYVVKRYQAFPNVMWDISKEALFYGRADDKYILERIQRLRQLDGYKRLVSVHDHGFCKRHPQAVDYLSMQTWRSELYTLTQQVVNKHKQMPVFNIEHGGYEDAFFTVWTGDWIDAEACLRRNYMSLFGGAYTTYYWQGASWNVVVHNPFQQEAGVYRPKFDYFKHMASFFTNFPFSGLKPMPKLNASGYCLGDKDGQWLFYVPKENYKIKVNALHPKNYAKGVERMYKWFNTLTGEYSQSKPINKVAWDVVFKSPWQGKADAILISWIGKPE